ncbi:MAG: response regulator [Candidatus Zophobacter franzmannii]|jgi:CheY-like chemotaxis protein|nr:response regulator [Candidatus Zophobacter franzmannii]
MGIAIDEQRLLSTGSIKKEKWDFKSKKILIVDDIITNRKVLRKQLEIMNLVVDDSASGKDALGLSDLKQYDLFCFDLRMPKMDGEELAKEIKDILGTDTKPIVCITASINPEEKYKLHNFDAVLFKPCSLRQIATTINKLIGEI